MKKLLIALLFITGIAHAQRQAGGVNYTPQFNAKGTGDTTHIQTYNSTNGTWSQMLTVPLGDARYAPISGGSSIKNQLTLQASSNFHISDTGIVGKHLRIGPKTSHLYPTKQTIASFEKDTSSRAMVVISNPNTANGNDAVGGILVSSGQPLTGDHGMGAGYVQMTFVDTLNMDGSLRAASNRGLISTGNRSEGLTIFSDADELPVPNPNRIRGIKLSVQKPQSGSNPGIFYPDLFIPAAGFGYSHRSYGIGMGTERVNKTGYGKALTMQTDVNGGIGIEMLNAARSTDNLVLGAIKVYGDTVSTSPIASIEMATKGTDNKSGEIRMNTYHAGVKKTPLIIDSTGTTNISGFLSIVRPTGNATIGVKSGSGYSFQLGPNAGATGTNNTWGLYSSGYAAGHSGNPIWQADGLSGVVAFNVSPTVPTPTGSSDAVPKDYVDARTSGALVSNSVAGANTPQTILTYAVGATNKVFEVASYLTIGSASGLSFNVNVSSTNENGAAQSYNSIVNASFNGSYGSNVHTLYAKAGTNIVISTNFTGTCDYNAGAYIRPVF